MAFWPRDERTETKTFSKGKKAATTGQKQGYTSLQSGMAGAASLSNNLEWTFLSNWQSKENDHRLKCGTHVEIFPPTRATPTKSKRMTLKRRTEEGTNFLRAYLPDVHVTADLIREQLSEDIAVARRLEQFDPYAGNTLDVFTLQKNSLESFLLFSTGETNCDLNSCSIDFSDLNRVLFAPRTKPVYSFPTPIQHLLTSPNPLVNNVAVRTFGCVSIFAVKAIDDSKSITMVEVADLSRSDFGDEAVVDMKFPSSPSRLLTLGNKGGMFECNFEYGTVTGLHQTETLTMLERKTPDFWRLALDTNVHNSFILSTNTVFQIDNRTRSTTVVFPLVDERHLLTSIEDVSQANYLQLCSTRDILWLDIRYPGKPLLAYAHGREFDQYLSTTTSTYPGQGPLTFLSCRNNGLVTVYDVSQNREGLIRHIGQRFLTDENGMGIVRLSDRGSVFYSVIKPANVESERDLMVQNKDMSNFSPKTREARPVLGEINYTECDLRESYHALFNRYFKEKLDSRERSSESLQQMLDFFPYYMRNNELPIEHILTTYDIAFRAGKEPREFSRADFLADGIINSSMAYEALKAGRLLPPMIKAPWHRSIASTIQRLDRDFRPDPQEMMDFLAQFDIVGAAVPEYARQLEQISRQHLTLDLTLACDIFSETKFSMTDDTDRTLETMTEALSLGGEPSPIKFGYLRPVPKNDYVEATDDLKLEIPMGVRLLLKEWDSGNPEDYIYKDPFTAEVSSPNLTPKSRQSPHAVDRPEGLPPILPSGIPPVILGKSGPIVHSQELTTGIQYNGDSQGQVGSSQDFAISTQILPGPFGGRPNGKKKPTKRRLGGF